MTPTDYENLHIVAATDRLTETAELLQARIRREERLSRALAYVEDDYDYIILDCPPVLGVLSYNALVAADLLLIPVQPGVGAITGLDSLLQAAAELRDEAVEDLNYRILTTMFEIRTNPHERAGRRAPRPSPVEAHPDSGLEERIAQPGQPRGPSGRRLCVQFEGCTGIRRPV